MRFWQIGIEMRPFFAKDLLWGYPVFAGVGAGVGYWLTGVEERQVKMLNERRGALLDKRRRRAERTGQPYDASLNDRPVVGPAATVGTAV